MDGRKQNDGALMRGFVAGVVIATVVLAGTAAVPRIQAALDTSAFYVPGFGQSLTESESSERDAEPQRDPELNALLADHMTKIQGGEQMSGAQAVLVETADGAILMSHNADRMLNPASVLKMATTLAALEKFGPEHRFRTVVTADGPIDAGTLRGTLGVRSDGDPTFGRASLQPVVAGIRGAGIDRVEGDLVVAGPFSFQTTDEPADAAARLREALSRAGVKISGHARLADQVTGAELVAVQSESLLDIVARQNAHSINRIADNLGTAVGGPMGLRRYLIEEVGVEPRAVHITHPSGLDDNLITARGTMLVLRRLDDVCRRHGVPLDRVMPLNGVDSSTMRTRLVADGFKGSVLAKTGTQANWGGGITTLAGVAHTNARGPVFFVFFNSVGDVHTYRKWQDALLRDTVALLGGPRPISRTHDVVPPGVEDHDAHMLARQRSQPPSEKTSPPSKEPSAGKRGD